MQTRHDRGHENQREALESDLTALPPFLPRLFVRKPSAMIREPAVAGRFYPRNAEQLERDVRKFLAPATGEGAAPVAVEKRAARRAFGCVVPHAGYMYSGAVAG